jgi:hypothetical protein
VVLETLRRVIKKEAEQYRKELGERPRDEFGDKLWVVDILNLKS